MGSLKWGEISPKALDDFVQWAACWIADKCPYIEGCLAGGPKPDDCPMKQGR